VLTELDYVNEAGMMSRVADFFADHPDIIVPRPVPGLIGNRAFASTFIEGRKITDVLDECERAAEAGDPSAKLRSAHVLGLLLECYVRQVLEAGVFQADPHPGNLLVTEADELVVLDFGCTKRMPEETRALYLALMQSFVAQDRERMAVLFGELGFATKSGSPETLHAFADALMRGFEKAASEGEAFAWMSQEDVFAQAAQLLEQSYEDPVIRLPAEFVMLARVFGTLGGLFHHYRPEIDFRKHLLPVLGNAMMKHSR
jgi:ubiquinone biosynthesis protein